MTNKLGTHLTNCLPVRRRFRERREAVERPAHEQPLGSLWALAISVWFGLSVGLLEFDLARFAGLR